jgi:hypothetical protein
MPVQKAPIPVDRTSVVFPKNGAKPILVIASPLPDGQMRMLVHGSSFALEVDGHICVTVMSDFLTLSLIAQAGTIRVAEISAGGYSEVPVCIEPFVLPASPSVTAPAP